MLGFAIGLTVGLFGGVIFTSLLTMAKISDLHEEIRVLYEMGKDENKSMSEIERG